LLKTVTSLILSVLNGFLLLQFSEPEVHCP
jgi:hypothetical protein